MVSAREANRRYFREAYRGGEHGWAVDVPSPYAVRFLRRLKQILPHGKLLDIGCGEGRHSVAAARLGFRVTAIDYEALALKCARRAAKAKETAGITFRKADVFSLPFPEASFDIILDYGCLHHQRKTDWPEYKASILRVLKAGGFYVLSVFSPDFHLFAGSRRNWHIAYGAYRRCFTRNEIIRLYGSDFQVVELVEQGGKDGGFWHALLRRFDRSEQVSTVS
jgi:ubiquinone/menaquinone biosynthesis C-methylase UbiE